MKNQALTTTLAVLLAVSLSAIVALVVSSEVIGGAPTAIVEAPAAVQILAPAPVAADNVADNSSPTAPQTQDAPAQDAPAQEPAEATETPDAPVEPATTPTPDAPAADEPGHDEPTEDEPVDDPEAPEMPEPPVDVEEPETGETPCQGTIIDGECVPISILCTLGYKLVGGDCVFVACPSGFKLDGDFCVPLGLTTPCPDGQTRVGNLCLLVLDPVVLEPLCGPGEKLVDGNCVSVCPPKTMWVGGFCLPEFDVDFDSPVLPDLDFVAANGS